MREQALTILLGGRNKVSGGNTRLRRARLGGIDYGDQRRVALDSPRQLETDVRGMRRYWAVIDGDEYSFEGH